MKTFRYKFTKLTFWLIIAGMVLCAAGFALNLYQCIRYGIASAADPVYPIIQYTTMFIVTVALFPYFSASSYFRHTSSTISTLRRALALL